jgi:hypothetical protein
MNVRKQYEEAVVLGGVLSPAVLLVVPFLKSTSHVWLVFAGTALVFVPTVIGAIWFRRRLGDARRIQICHLIIAVLLSFAFSICAIALAGLMAGPWAAAILAALMLFMLLGALHFARDSSYAIDHSSVDEQTIGRFAAIGATAGSAVLVFLGGLSIAVVVGILHVVLAVLTGVVAVTAFRRLSEASIGS